MGTMNTKKICISLHESDIEWLKEMAVRESVSSIDILRRAIQIEKFITDCEDNGRKVLIKDTKGNVTQLMRLHRC